VRLPCGPLAALPLGLGRRVVRAAAARAGQRPPDAAATDAVLALVRGAGPGRQAVWAGGGRAVRQGDGILLPAPARDLEDPPVPGG
jgi:hypothetical protein